MPYTTYDFHTYQYIGGSCYTVDLYNTGSRI